MCPSPRGRPAGDVRVFVVEDHPVLRGVVRLACEHTDGLALAGEAATGEEAVEGCRTTRPDVVVLDLSLPGDLQGLDVARALRSEGTAGRILVLTGRTDDEAVFAAIRVGADGYLEKTAGVRFIADALLRVAAGERVFTAKQERIARSQLGEMARRTRESSDVRAVLTQRELQILELLSRGVTVKQVATRLGLSPRTVETHISKLYRKLGVRNRVQAVSKATAIGLVELS
ncbi:MAG TPA: response regulator transcription factor [Actinomycetota bacterium]|nr:response regulator transcription factor [Actinomycetota bacterium]